MKFGVIYLAESILSSSSHEEIIVSMYRRVELKYPSNLSLGIDANTQSALGLPVNAQSILLLNTAVRDKLCAQ